MGLVGDTLAAPKTKGTIFLRGRPKLSPLHRPQSALRAHPRVLNYTSVNGAVVIVILWSLLSIGFVSETIDTLLVVHPSSTVTINGKTNVNKFACAIAEYRGTDTLLLTAVRGKGAYFKKGLVKLHASGFDCEKKVITKDFGEMIQSEKYPDIKIDFASFERMPKYETTEEKFKGKLTITLAAVAVPCEVKCSIVKDEKNLIHLRGKQAFKFSDFNLEAPTKALGMIKVDENITVNFHLVLSMK